MFTNINQIALHQICWIFISPVLFRGEFIQHWVPTSEFGMMSHWVEASHVVRGKVTEQQLAAKSSVDKDNNRFFAGEENNVTASLRLGAQSTLLRSSILDGLPKKLQQWNLTVILSFQISDNKGLPGYMIYTGIYHGGDIDKAKVIPIHFGTVNPRSILA